MIEKSKKRLKPVAGKEKNVQKKENDLEDIAEIMGVAEMLTRHINQFEVAMSQEIQKLEVHVRKLENEVELLRR